MKIIAMTKACGLSFFAVRTAALGALLLVCSGCDPNAPLPAIATASGPAFATIPLKATNMYGGGFSGGVLIVSHESGAVSVCYKNCTLIGKVAPAGANDLVLDNTAGYGAYITNVITGHVAECLVDIDDDNKFKGGHCEEIGMASR